MKFVEDFRNRDMAAALADALKRAVRPDRSYVFMEFCGGHTHAISRYGLIDLLPPNVRLVHGPGCPVCVLPVGRIDMAVGLVRSHPVTLCTYGDCLRVPGSNGVSVLKARGLPGPAGAEVRMVYSVMDALDLARTEAEREVVFLAIGFETTTPATAVALKRAREGGVRNFSILCNHVLTPPAMAAILAPDDGQAVGLDGFIGPAHVSTVIGTAPYRFVCDAYHKPVVIAGFEPLDVLQAVLMLVRQVDTGIAVVENQYSRAVAPDGNRKAQALTEAVFQRRAAFEWRGLGSLRNSALALRPEYAPWDAEAKFGLRYHPVPEPKGCDCALVLRGLKAPSECRLFATACTPDHPIGSCMVSAEGACAARFTYGRFRPRPPAPIAAAPPLSAP